MVADLLETQRGAHGGYRLAWPTEAISLVEIVEAMEGPITVNDCAEGAQVPCMVARCCCRSRNWNSVKKAIRNALKEVSLEGLIDPAHLFVPLDCKSDIEGRAPTGS